MVYLERWERRREEMRLRMVAAARQTYNVALIWKSSSSPQCRNLWVKQSVPLASTVPLQKSRQGRPTQDAWVRLKSRKSCSLVQMVRVVRFLKKGGRWTVAVKRTAKLRMKREARAATR